MCVSQSAGIEFITSITCTAKAEIVKVHCEMQLQLTFGSSLCTTDSHVCKCKYFLFFRSDAREHHMFMNYLRLDKSESALSFQEFLFHVQKELAK